MRGWWSPGARGRCAGANGRGGAERARQVGGLEPGARGPRPTGAEGSQGRGQPAALPGRPSCLRASGQRRRHSVPPRAPPRRWPGTWAGTGRGECVSGFSFSTSHLGKPRQMRPPSSSFPDHPGHSPFLPVSFPGPHPLLRGWAPSCSSNHSYFQEGERGWRVSQTNPGLWSERGPGWERLTYRLGKVGEGWKRVRVRAQAWPSQACPRELAFPVSTSSGLSALPLLSLERGAAQGGGGTQNHLPWPPNTGASEPPTGSRTRVRGGWGPVAKLGDFSAPVEAAEVETSLLEESWSGVTAVGGGERPPTPAPPPYLHLLPAELGAWTRAGPIAHTGQGPGMSWEPARAGGGSGLQSQCPSPVTG